MSEQIFRVQHVRAASDALIEYVAKEGEAVEFTVTSDMFSTFVETGSEGDEARLKVLVCDFPLNPAACSEMTGIIFIDYETFKPTSHPPIDMK